MIGMTEPTNVSKLRMTRASAEKIIREISADSSNVLFKSGHAQERSDERDITFLDALKILQEGFVDEDPSPGKYDGEWQTRVVKKLRGNREAGVATVILTKKRKLKIKTVRWED